MRSDVPQGQLFHELGIDEQAKEAVAFIQENCVTFPIAVAFSGGKDSIVTAELMRLSKVPYKLYYSFTTIDPPEVVRFIRKEYPEAIFLKPPKPFWALVLEKFPPTIHRRWCCDELKHKGKPTKMAGTLVLGIRREESFKRKAYQRIDYSRRSNKKQPRVYPILYWRECDVWEFIESRELAYPSLYDEGWDRLGCVICPFRSRGLLEQSKRRWPGMYKAWENTVHKWWMAKKAEGKQMKHSSSQEFLTDWYNPR